MRTRQKIINLFDDSAIHAIKQVVSIGDEEDLNQLWEYIITYHTLSNSATYGFFITLYQLSTQFLEESNGIFFEIIIERSDEAFYFTIWNRYFAEYALKIWDKRKIEYRTDDKRITVRLLKSILDEKVAYKVQNDEHRVNSLLSSVRETPSENKMSPYDFIQKEDLKELTELTEDLSEYIFEAKKSGFNSDVVTRVRSLFSMISIILNYYPQIDEVAVIMTEFSVFIAQHKEMVSEMDTAQIALIEGFIHNFERWLHVLFVEGGAQLNFMNRSLRADVEMIRGMIEPVQSDEVVDLDAIFDF